MHNLFLAVQFFPQIPVILEVIAGVLLGPALFGLLWPTGQPWLYCGRNTKIGLLKTGFRWLRCGAVLLAANLGKGVACWLAARATGLPNREALGIGGGSRPRTGAG